MKIADSFRSLLGTRTDTKAPETGGSCCHGDEACERPSGASGPAPTQQLEVTVEKGYRPARLTARAGAPVRITFFRNETSGCSKEVVFPGLGIRRALPTGERVSIDLPPQAAGIVPFTCGMGMMKGGIEVR
ncbi:MAG: cupredoxin domain-containing protein [Holophagales bacterium]|nr:cupredoxin domain-containing protein [Holophagales bacterium]